jgi:predicted tellurium resistance membrane protein TerC
MLKTAAIIVLLFIGFHLLLYGYVRRRIEAAKRVKEIEDDS